VHGKVVEREKNPDGSLKGKSNSNHILDSRSYKVEFRDGTYGHYSPKTLIENLYSQIDEEGRSSTLLSSIVGHRKDENAVPLNDGYITIKSGGTETCHHHERLAIRYRVDSWYLVMDHTFRLESK